MPAEYVQRRWGHLDVVRVVSIDETWPKPGRYPTFRVRGTLEIETDGAKSLWQPDCWIRPEPVDHSRPLPPVEAWRWKVAGGMTPGAGEK